MIYFPAIKASFSIQPVAFCLFGRKIYFYAICIVLAIIVAMVLAYRSKEKFGVPFEFLLESLIPAIIVGLVGARIYYVIFHLENYQMSKIWKVFSIRDGGLAIYGGLIAGAWVIWKKCQKSKVEVFDFFDYLVPFVAIAQSIGRWGNFFNQEAYGIETTSFFRMGMFTDSRL